MRSKVIILFILTTLCIVFNSIICKGQESLSYFLPDISYDASIPTPESVLGYQVGEWHPSHDHLRMYLKELCESSPKCQYQEYARTHENRPLFNLLISNPSNLSNQEAIREKRDQLVNPYNETVDMDVPLVVYQGYSIHGNESSGASASLLVAYYLLAGQGAYLDELLSTSMIFIDPCYNPDGLHRFSTWANMHKHSTPTTDPNSREFNEVWPGGRTNHYWFDLNRDWLFNIHPSSKGRIKTFQKWKPDILTDHHEMGSNSSFFFQPGVPSRTNPNTPQVNQDLTGRMANYHRRNLDSLGCKYFSKERFDDYYYGKGSTYPDIQGCIGILFEQASSRGHLRETKNGLLSFPFCVRNQVTTSLSTQRASLAMRDSILRYKRNFYVNQPNRKGYYIFECEDEYRAKFLLDLLGRHSVEVQIPTQNFKVGDTNFDATHSYVVPKNQRQSGLVKTIFEPVHEFRDSIFYDVSAWTIPFALDIKYVETAEIVGTKLKSLSGDKVQQKRILPLSDKATSLLISWSEYETPALLYKLLDSGLKVQALSKPYKKDNVQHPGGTLLIPLQQDSFSRAEIHKMVLEQSAQQGLAFGQIDWKTKAVTDMEQPSIAMVIGEGINAYEAGATWYQIDKRLKMPVTMMDFRQFGKANLNRYNVIILPDGKYGEMEKPEKLREWIAAGGTLIAMRRSINYTSEQGWTSLTQRKHPANDTIPDNSKARGAQVIGGAIIASKIDLEHPLFYGYGDEDLPVFKRGVQFYEPKKSSASPMVYTDDPMMSGYASGRNVKLMKGAGGVFCDKLEKGKIISLVDNPNFRGYWLGGSKLFANCLFMREMIEAE